MSRLKLTLASLIALVGLAAAPVMIADNASAAVNPNKSLCEGSGGKWSGGTCLNARAEGRTVESFIVSIVNILLFLVGVVSVVMIIIGAIKFTTSGGDQAAVKSAKNTVLYAVIGLIVAFLAFAAVQFVLGSLSKSSGSGSGATPVRME